MVRMTSTGNETGMVSTPESASTIEVKRKVHGPPDYNLLKESMDIHLKGYGLISINQFNTKGKTSYHISIHQEKNMQTTVFTTPDKEPTMEEIESNNKLFRTFRFEG